MLIKFTGRNGIAHILCMIHGDPDLQRHTSHSTRLQSQGCQAKCSSKVQCQPEAPRDSRWEELLTVMAAELQGQVLRTQWPPQPLKEEGRRVKGPCPSHQDFECKLRKGGCTGIRAAQDPESTHTTAPPPPRASKSPGSEYAARARACPASKAALGYGKLSSISRRKLCP